MKTTLLFATVSCLLLFTFVAQAQPKPITPEKAVMMGYVEHFLMNNFRDVTMRKSLEWGEVKTDDKGNRTIRYTVEALIWDKDRMILCTDFTFDEDGQFVKTEKVEGFPKPVVVEKPDVTTLEGVKKLVEKFFTQNFMDISARKTIRWGELERHEDGSVSLVYRYEATIRDKDKIIQERRFTFDKNGEVKSWNPTENVPQPVLTPIVEGIESRVPMMEIPIYGGNPFKFRRARGGSAETVSLTMHVVIRKTDEAAFKSRYKQCKNELDDRVAEIMHAFSLHEYAEVGHLTLKEKAKKAINEVLGTPWVQQVFIPKLSYEMN
jgi:hypothetical protein